jgi:hypothetical protein
MRLRSRWHQGHRLLLISQAVVGVIMALSAASLKIKIEDPRWPETVVAFIRVLQEMAWWFTPLGTFWCFVAQWMKKILGSPTFLWGTIKFLLDQLRHAVFAEIDQAGHHDRVTLFAYRKIHFCRRLFGFGWLVPVERSGDANVTRMSKAYFRAPDDGDGAEGIAGKAWANKKMVYVSNLPELGQGINGYKAVDYAKQVFLPTKWVEKKARKTKLMPRSLCGIPVEVKGVVWGVIVIDSRSPEIPGKDKIQEFYDKNAAVLSKLLEHV